jgi:hypothetical protein
MGLALPIKHGNFLFRTAGMQLLKGKVAMQYLAGKCQLPVVSVVGKQNFRAYTEKHAPSWEP